MILHLLIAWACKGTPTDTDTVDTDPLDDTVLDSDLLDTVDTGPNPLDQLIAEAIAAMDDPPRPLDPPASVDPALVALGQALFWDPLLSGNKDTACASCHHPLHGLADGLPLSLGTGAEGVGPARAEGERPAWLPRHAPSLYNVGESELVALFWDGRVELGEDGLSAPLPIPEGLSGPLAAQALHPLLSGGEMLGAPGDSAVDGSPNEIAELDSPNAQWEAIVARLRVTEGYTPLFGAAFPEAAPPDWTIVQVGDAIAAYQTQTFRVDDSPWDRYLMGDSDALTDAQKLGASLFFGAAGCGACHGGALLSDGRFHNTGVPQLGPGVGDAAPYDHGREEVSGDAEDRFAFRTPPLRNVALSAPYMHSGTLETLEEIVLHYAHPDTTAALYDPARLDPELAAMLHQDADHIDALLSTLSPDLPVLDEANAVGLSNIREFMGALSDPAWEDPSALIPAEVPSGLEPPR